MLITPAQGVQPRYPALRTSYVWCDCGGHSLKTATRITIAPKSQKGHSQANSGQRIVSMHRSHVYHVSRRAFSLAIWYPPICASGVMAVGFCLSRQPLLYVLASNCLGRRPHVNLRAESENVYKHCAIHSVVKATWQQRARGTEVRERECRTFQRTTFLATISWVSKKKLRAQHFQGSIRNLLRASTARICCRRCPRNSSLHPALVSLQWTKQ